MKETIEQFLARGNSIQKVRYLTFEEVGEIPTGKGFRKIIDDSVILAQKSEKIS